MIDVLGAKVFGVTVVMAVSMPNFVMPVLLSKVPVELVSCTEFFVVGRCFNRGPTVATQMIDHQRGRQGTTNLQNISTLQRDPL